MSATRSPAEGAAVRTASPLDWPVSWLVAAGTVLLLLVVLVAAVLGPLVGILLLAVVVGGALVLRYPVVALALPVVVAPIGLRALPGGGGLQFIHLAVMAALGGALIAVGTGKVPFRPPVAMAFGLLFVASMFASTMVSEDPFISLRVSVNHLLGVGLAGAVAITVRASRDSMLWLMRGWVLAAIVLIVPALPSALLASELFGGSLVRGRVQGAFAQPNDFGEFCLLSAVVAAALLAGRHPPRDRWLGFAGLLASVAGSAVSFSRGTWLGVASCLLVVAILSPQMRTWVAGMVGVMMFALMIGAAFGQAPFPTLVARLSGLDTASPEDDRPIIFAQAIRLFRENPTFGVGPGGFLASSQEPGSELILHTYVHGHSVILTTAAELGLIGVVTLLAFTIALGVATIDARGRLLAVGDTSENRTLAVLAGGLVGIAIHGLIDVVYTNPLLIPLAWFLAGLVAGLTAHVTDRLPLGRSPVRSGP